MPTVPPCGNKEMVVALYRYGTGTVQSSDEELSITLQ